ncbi:Glutamate--cysteine ligase [compost metagenome]
MSELLQRRLALLGAPEHLSLLGQNLHGIERECLRVDADGQLALTPHPRALGSTLTHPQITTDYSESLLEFITPAEPDPADTLADLERVHRFTYAKLGGERLWSASMPCPLPDEEHIPIADYGSSNIGRLKYVYRKGLALRYGKTMQCFRRYSWLLMYLFGASPALDANFMRGRPHQLKQLDEHSLYLPYATSLRMSDLGYQSSAQSGLTPCYNDLASYTDSLRQAVSTPYPPYAAFGTKQGGEWQQLNTNVIQIENEYYSSIRPKRVTYSGERPIQALMARGVQYIEVRCLDINPFLPLGIDLAEARFLDLFLLYCALEDSPLLADGECRTCTENFLKVVKEGRRPGLHLQRRDRQIGLREWGLQLLDAFAPIAALLDRLHGGDAHAQSLAAQRAKLDDPALTPSAQVLAELQTRGESFAEFALRQSQAHADYFRQTPLSGGQQAAFEAMAAQSLAEQAELEAQPRGDFDAFVAAYQASIIALAV